MLRRPVVLVLIAAFAAVGTAAAVMLAQQSSSRIRDVEPIQLAPTSTR